MRSSSEQQPLHPHSNSNNPKVYFDIQIGHRQVGQIVFELFSNITPRTVENFRSLCSGERGNSSTSGHKLHYKGSPFHRIISGFMAQGGDITNGNGSGGESIYGRKFDDENFLLKHDRCGLLSMANSGLNTNGSQFFITFRDTPHLDGRHVVFGQIISGFEVLKVMEMVATDSNDCPKTVVIISDCGQVSFILIYFIFILQIGEESETNVTSSNTTTTTTVASSSLSSSSSNNSNNSQSNLENSTNSNETSEITTTSEVEDKPLTEEQIEEATNGMTETQKRLFKIKMKMNQGRKANKEEVCI